MEKAAKDSVKPVVVDTTGLYEKHKTIYARSVAGLFNTWRWGMVFFTQLLFYGVCWLEWSGRQAVLFHLVERKFYIFGWVFLPQDAIYLAVLLVISAYLLFLVTAVGGRLFCGYACPQTVYTEILMWVERKIEGDRAARMKLDAQPMSARKFRLKATKHFLWLTIALWTGFTFVGYFTPIRELAASVTTLSLGPWEIFWIFFYAGFLYMMAGFLREQVCKYMCPYARFQGVMFDPDTLIITYDANRGEPRGARKKNADYREQGLGDCVDCSLCVQVCPTGIDIRNGLQYECIACAACIDACDEVMDKVGSPRGLVRYSTENAMDKHFRPKDILVSLGRPRTLVYLAILFLIVGATGWSLVNRVSFRLDILRDRSTLYLEADEGQIENVYTLRVMNADESAQRFTIKVGGIEGIHIVGKTSLEVEGAQTKTIQLAVSVEEGAGRQGSNPVFFELVPESGGRTSIREKTTFFMP